MAAVAPLFDEAWARRRRRRRASALAALLAAGVVAAVLLIGGGGGGGMRATPTEGTPPSATASLALPRADDVTAISVAGGRLIVSGGPEGSLIDSGTQSTLAGGRAAGLCDSAVVVAAATIRLGPVRRANCGDPALYGERVLPVASVVRRPVGTIALRIATVDGHARDGYALGPVVARYEQCSDCQAGWVYGERSLWIWVPLASGLPRNDAELLRVSERTGAVVERWLMPEMVRALLAVDADGLWIAPSLNTGWPIGIPASRRIAYESLDRVAAGSARPIRVFSLGPGGAAWLVATGHTVWLAARGTRQSSVVWRLVGSRPHPQRLRARLSWSVWLGEEGAGAATVAGDTAIGVATVTDGRGHSQRVLRVTPDGSTRGTGVSVTGPARGEYPPPPATVALGRSLFFLDAPELSYAAGSAAPAFDGGAVLFRVTVR